MIVNEAPRPKVDGSDNFVLGMDSYTLPSQLQNGEYEIGMNLINRGGLAQTRPGSVVAFQLPEGNLQGCTLFTPSSGATHLVFAVDGVVYASPAPFRTYSQIANLQFRSWSPQIAWAQCVQSTYFSDSGELLPLETPKAVLLIQDGATRAGYWDGAVAAHLNPIKSGQEATLPGFDETPVGLWMVWSNNRLWVSRGSRIFASDIGNPLKFTETQYLNEGRSFYLPGPCTGMTETQDRKGIICFTAESADYIQSSIQDRTLWLQTPDFQRTVLPKTGCVAPRSIVQQYGLLWWFTGKGLINLNDALQANISSRMDVQDNEMFQSKYGLWQDLSLVCGAFTENFLFHAVPYASRQNTRMHVLDQAPFEGQVNSWPSFWEGWRPVEFASGTIKTQERVFCASKDYDGVNRMWELFRPEKTDNGIPITSYLITRQHYFGDRDWKKFLYAEIEMRNIVGATAVSVAVSGTKGAFQQIMAKDVNSLVGQVYYNQQYGYEANSFAGTRSQSRIMTTQQTFDPSACNEECVESNERGLIDKAFSLMIMWSGIAGLVSYRIFALSEPREYRGLCEPDETGEERLISSVGCGVIGLFSEGGPYTEYTSTQDYTDPDNPNYWARSTQTSFISQIDADRRALKTAMAIVQLDKQQDDA